MKILLFLSLSLAAVSVWSAESKAIENIAADESCRSRLRAVKRACRMFGADAADMVDRGQFVSLLYDESNGGCRTFITGVDEGAE